MIRKILLSSSLFICLLNFPADAQQTKGDPWIFKIYKALYNRQPNVWELNSDNYNLGSWSNYEELKTYIDQYNKSLNHLSIKIKINTVGDKSLVIFYEGSKLLAANLVSNDGGTILASGGANITALIPDIISNAEWNLKELIPGGGASLRGIAGIVHVNSSKISKAGSKVLKTSGNGFFLIK